MNEALIDPDFELLETLLFEPESRTLVSLDSHVQRMETSALDLGFSFSRSAFLSALETELVRSWPARRSRVRITLSRAGEFTVTLTPLPFLAPDSPEACATVLSAASVHVPRNTTLRRENLPKVVVSRKKTSPTHRLLFHKTTRRELYDNEYRELSARTGCYEVLFTNTAGELTEGSRTNLLLKIGSKWLTPPVRCGLLNGVFRQTLLRQSEFHIEEQPLFVTDLYQAERVFVMNSVRGLIEVLPDDWVSRPGPKGE